MDVLNKKLRGDILQLLKNINPSTADENSIIAAYYQYYKPLDIRRALAYLTDSEYIEAVQKPHPFRKYAKTTVYKLAPKGTNLLEGDADDIGVEIIDEED